MRPHHRRERIHHRLQDIGKGLGAGEYRLKHHEQQRKQHNRPGPGVQQHPVQPRMHAVARGFGNNRRLGDGARLHPPLGHVEMGTGMQVTVG